VSPQDTSSLAQASWGCAETVRGTLGDSNGTTSPPGTCFVSSASPFAHLRGKHLLLVDMPPCAIKWWNYTRVVDACTISLQSTDARPTGDPVTASRGERFLWATPALNTRNRARTARRMDPDPKTLCLTPSAPVQMAARRPQELVAQTPHSSLLRRH
jgi:hypothetical protein